MESVHELLVAAAAAEPAASARLFEAVYAELKRLAHSLLRHDGRIDGPDTTALMHESFWAWTAVAKHARPIARPFGYVGRVMHSVVIDHVRDQQTLKRGGG
ncbi:ECF-type sigma factor [Roseateles saccharophilus]|uniref:ECF sigma factor n=2 Tax=Roseateles saccharophilus TaxID=304 RepID=A0A4R3UNA5_ROSSA|nr:ECF-type sigma factor [Roseateles saccharophilus]TCU92141.1 ECF sigma factor [Roseateles saccharophilus]